MSRRTRDEYQRSVEQDRVDDLRAQSPADAHGANIEALRELPREPVQVSDFAINRPGVGVQKRCGRFPHGCGEVIEGPGHVCTRGRYAGQRRG